MPLQFTVLASGSGGNASLIDADGFGVLLDVGLGPRQLAARLTAAGAGWKNVRAALLTHTHSDHWNDTTFNHLLKLKIPLFCHPEHHAVLRTYCAAFPGLRAAGLVRDYAPDEELPLAPALNCRPFQVRHDGGMTCGFRFEGAPDMFAAPCVLVYAADLGCWHAGLAQTMADADVLALEFNHDVALERASGRSPRLIARVLGDDGHLSNAQAAELVREVLRLSEPGRLQHLVQLHLSRDCNRPALAAAAAQAVLAQVRAAAQVHTAEQDRAGPTLAVGAPPPRAPRRRAGPRRPAPPPVSYYQPFLPGWEA
jgi:phosphoribosyl 1,2-cyclic phosphodiesterase